MKRTFYYLLVILLVLVGTGYYYANHTVKNKVEAFLQTQLSPQVNFSYDRIDMALWSGDLSFDMIDVALTNPNDDTVHTTAQIKNLQLQGLSYWNFLFDDIIEIDEVLLDQNDIVYFKNRYQQDLSVDSLKRNPLAMLKKAVLIKHLEIDKVSLSIYNDAADSVLVHVANASLQVENIRTDSLLLSQRIPLAYDELSLVTDAIKVKISPYEDIFIDRLQVANNQLELDSLMLVPKYSKPQFEGRLKQERDYMQLSIPHLSIDNFDYGFDRDRFFTTISDISIHQPDFKIYRDKLIADNTQPRPLYSKMLRNLPIDVLVDSIHINDAGIKYEERVRGEGTAGTITFQDLDLTLSTVGNMQSPQSTTHIKATGLFFDSRITTDWSFKVHDTSDQFRFMGSIHGLAAQRINSFTLPNLNIGFEGDLHQIYFDITGDDDRSQTKIKMAYTDFEIDLMRQREKGINKFLSKAANLFVAKNSSNDQDDFREGTGDSQRDKTKSFFNYVWISLLAALINTVT